MARSTRKLVVLIGLVVAGGIFGSVAAMLAILGFGAMKGGAGSPDYFLVLFLSVALGGPLGAVLGPIVMWTVLRRVPLGLAIGLTSLATAVGGAVGMMLGAPMLGAFLGFFGATIWLHERAPAAATLPPADPS